MKETLIQIFEALNRIETKGGNTLIMADCLRALAEVIKQEGESNEAKE